MALFKANADFILKILASCCAASIGLECQRVVSREGGMFTLSSILLAVIITSSPLSDLLLSSLSDELSTKLGAVFLALRGAIESIDSDNTEESM